MIRLAVYEDIPQIMEFIDTHWKKDHILARDRAFFEYQYVSKGEVNVVLSVEDASGAINGMLGFVPYSRLGESEIIYALWKVIQTDDPFLGMKLMKFLKDQSNGQVNACAGINDLTIPMYQFMGFQTGSFVQWYRLSENTAEKTLRIASVENHEKPELQEIQWEWKEYLQYADFEKDYAAAELKEHGVCPYKPAEYIRYRYFEHPSFTYRVFGLVGEEQKVETFVVIRLQQYDGAVALRVIDCIGEMKHMERAGGMIDTLLAQTGAEYADIFEVGIPAETMLRGGWLQVEGSGNIFPDYFAPYVQKNVKINYSSTEPNIVLFKGDGDQDRPN